MMMAMNGKAHFSSALDGMRRVCLNGPQLQANIFAGFDESVLAAADLASSCHAAFKPDASRHAAAAAAAAAAMATHTHAHGPEGLGPPPPPPPPSSLEAELLEHLSSSLVEVHAPLHAHPHHHHHHHLHAQLPAPPTSIAPAPPSVGVHVESDPRELEAFAERFKQRRVKLGVDAGGRWVPALGPASQSPGVGALSQSTICRFESLTLSHNNMIALRPVLQAWLDEAEAEHRRATNGSAPLVGGLGNERKRKRTSIAAPEKRSLEAYFAIQPRPSSEKIAAIAEKLELKKNVVRVWFCNQRQKQKRMKYSAAH
ncbi:hypothetical protein NFI96_033670 [Prochilodus magdalenae]|nr:hypothetical protein NFI96_033670 [Prochilodus magdalenae]